MHDRHKRRFSTVVWTWSKHWKITNNFKFRLMCDNLWASSGRRLFTAASSWDSIYWIHNKPYFFPWNQPQLFVMWSERSLQAARQRAVSAGEPNKETQNAHIGLRASERGERRRRHWSMLCWTGLCVYAFAIVHCESCSNAIERSSGEIQCCAVVKEKRAEVNQKGKTNTETNRPARSSTFQISST